MVRLGEIEVRRGEEPAAAVPKEDVAEPAADDDEITGELHSASDPQDAATTELESESEPVSAAEEDGDFDLAAELSDVFEEDASAHRARSSAGTEEEGFEQVFAAFKAGVDRELGAGDHEARYDLGIAYKEMGLLDDAIGEFRVAMQDADRRLQSLHMMGVCALDLGRAEDAVAHFEQALAVQDVPEDQQMALRFDLGRAEEARGDRERARAAWEAVVAFDPDFQDVGSRLEALDREPPPEPVSDDSEEAFESFDDLIDESVADEPAAEPEAAEEYESFDDLMSDDDDDEDESTEAAAAAAELSGPESAAVASAPEDDPAGADVTQVAEVTAEETEEPVLDMAPAEAFDAVPEPDPDPESPAPKKRRRKRISFM
jgi:tetratricopeptide (TPR) repeat protein